MSDTDYRTWVTAHLDDIDVREVLRSNHRPEERLSTSLKSYVICVQCTDPWPCEVRQLVRAYEEAEQDRWRKEKMEEQEKMERQRFDPALNFRSHLAQLLNRFNYDGRLRTMDWMIADHLLGVLDNLSMMLLQRDTKQTGVLDPHRQLEDQA
jgi:hypothetical protein